MRKFDEEMMECLHAIVEENPMLTLSQINEALRRRLPNKPRVSIKTLSCKLDGLLFTTKIARDLPADRNAPRVLVTRRQFCEWLLSAEVVNSIKVFVDEFGFDLWMRRSIGRAPRGQRAYRRVATQKGPRLTVCLAISPSFGLVHYQLYHAGMTKERFAEFINITIGNVDLAAPNQGFNIIIDNASCHNEAELLEVPNSVTVRRLPVYSPFLTPVENAISAWKAAIKRALTYQESYIDPTEEDLRGRTLAAYRRDSLEQLANERVNIITRQNCIGWYNHSLSYVPRCIAEEPIDG
ncbi:MAG: transposase [Kangiellaceae bacterium]|nr:transposase [Kangiellaceae bacterium]